MTREMWQWHNWVDAGYPGNSLNLFFLSEYTQFVTLFVVMSTVMKSPRGTSQSCCCTWRRKTLWMPKYGPKDPIPAQWGLKCDNRRQRSLGDRARPPTVLRTDASSSSGHFGCHYRGTWQHCRESIAPCRSSHVQGLLGIIVARHSGVVSLGHMATLPRIYHTVPLRLIFSDPWEWWHII
jgi:hypothetical protein